MADDRRIGRRWRRAVLGMILAACAAVLAGCSAAGAPDARQEQLVVWPLVGDGATYRRVVYPAQAGTVRVLANTPVVIEARISEVYYWPITREYRADLVARNEPVEGDVRITDASGASRIVLNRPYVVWYPNGVASGSAQLLVDEAALETYARYVSDARAHAESQREYDLLVAEHNAAVSEWLRQAAEGVEPLPPPPPELTATPPEPYRGYASEPAEAAVVGLPRGEYLVELIDTSGQPITGGTRRLVAIAPRREGVGYAVVPGSRWTQPLTALDPADTIYVSGDTDIYLEPLTVAEYNAAHFVRLLDPQSLEAPDQDRYFWAPRSEVPTARLRVERDGQVETIERAGYRVIQVPGQERGYTIVPMAAGDPAPPDLRAIHLPADRLDGATIELLDQAERDGSTREIRRVNRVPELAVYAPVLLPLLFVVGASLYKRRGRGAMPA